MPTTIATLSLDDIGATLDWQSDNTVTVTKKELWTSVSLSLSEQDADEAYEFIKSQRVKAGKPT